MNVKKVMRWLGIGWLLLVVTVLLLWAFGANRVRAAHARKLSYKAELQVPSGPEAIARGKQLAHAAGGCVDCHGPDLGGATFFDDPPVARLQAPNLTSGKNGLGGKLTDADVATAMLHGIGKDGHPLLLMPADKLRRLHDQDLGALIAYMRSVPPVDSEPIEQSFGPIGAIMGAMGKIRLFPVDYIDHSARGPELVRPAASGAP